MKVDVLPGHRRNPLEQRGSSMIAYAFFMSK
jgi:hypothetical protein